MKRKNQKLLSLTAAILLALSFAIFFTACDMVYVADPESKSSGKGNGNAVFLTEAERDNLENTGHFLKLICMPVNTQVGNVFSVKIANSSSDVGRLNKNNPICIFKESNSYTATVYIPLSYNDDTDFLETGSFYTAFTIHVDAVKKYVVDLSDKVLVDYTDGRGTYDVRNIPQAGAADLRYLTVFNLPSGFVSQGISEVAVHNMYTPIASCKDYSLVEVFTSDSVTSVRIPLNYENSNSVFTANGSYFVSFELYYDALSHYSVSAQDRVTVNFINGNGFLDIGNMEGETIPYLSVIGLPSNITKKHFSNISVYNMTGSVAGCSNNNNIIILKESYYSTALIPLSYGGSDYFRDTGIFIVSFTVNIDALTQIIFSRSDGLMLDFFKGNASLDLIATLGFFSAELTNPSDVFAPVIKKDSSFDINGFIYKTNNDLVINSFLPLYSGVVYLYAYRNENEVSFEYSATAPNYNNSKKGYYNGNKRALWKMFLCTIPPSTPTGVPQYFFLAKTKIDDNWNHLSSFIIDNRFLIDSFSAVDPVFSLTGESDPPPASVTLEPGIYLVHLVGAGGGSAYNNDKNNIIFTNSYFLYNPSEFVECVLYFSSLPNTLHYSSTLHFFLEKNPSLSSFIPDSFEIDIKHLPLLLHTKGGDGGIVTELLFVNSTTTFTAFTGSGGKKPSSTLGYASGGGGGGSGSFLFSDQGYLLCAGGGAGSPGVSSFAPGGGGGFGGGIGSGAGGGASGLLKESLSIITTTHRVSSHGDHSETAAESAKENIVSSDGGNGGGYKGGRGGLAHGVFYTKDGSNGFSFVPIDSNISENNLYENPYNPQFLKVDKIKTLDLDRFLSTFGTFYSQEKTASYQTFPGGSGGAAFYLSNSNIYNTLGVNGIPEPPPALPSCVSLSNNRKDVGTDNTLYFSVYNFSYTEKTDQRNGGNNRNSERGGGGSGGGIENTSLYVLPIPSPNGKAGSIAVYKIQ
jgi:hypothetical protein